MKAKHWRHVVSQTSMIMFDPKIQQNKIILTDIYIQGYGTKPSPKELQKIIRKTVQTEGSA